MLKPASAPSIRTADWVRVLFARRDGSAVAAALARWRGAVDGALEATLIAMASNDVLAAIGPYIGPERFEVGSEAITAAETRAELRGLVKAAAGDRILFGLGGYCERVLRQAGLQKIERVEGCTHCDAQRFFSHRRGQGRTGRQISVIALADPPQIGPKIFG